MQEFGVLPFDVAEIPERLHQHGIIFALLVLAPGMPEHADPGDAISARAFRDLRSQRPSRCCTEQMDELPSSHGRPPRPRCILVGNFGLRQTARIERTPSAPTVGEIAPDGTSGKARALTIANPCPVLAPRNVEAAAQHRSARQPNPEGPATSQRTRQRPYPQL